MFAFLATWTRVGDPDDKPSIFSLCIFRPKSGLLVARYNTEAGYHNLANTVVEIIWTRRLKGFLLHCCCVSDILKNESLR